MSCAGLVDFPRKGFQFRIANDPCIELRVLAAAMLAWIVTEEFALRDARRPEGIGFQDVGTCIEEAAVYV